VSPVRDEAWKEAAENSREALSLMGYHVGARCLPGEPDQCGGTYAEHAMAQMVTLKAICDHELDQHLGPDPRAGKIYDKVFLELNAMCSQTGHS
jgi:hypothetical protein